MYDDIGDKDDDDDGKNDDDNNNDDDDDDDDDSDLYTGRIIWSAVVSKELVATSPIIS